MRLVDGETVYAASDLNDWLACVQRVALRRDALAHGTPVPDDDPTLAIVARKGLLHERRVFDAYVAEGRAVTTIADDEGVPGNFERAVGETRAAMIAGADVIYQAAFRLDGWSGRADFLLRREAPSALGSWSYDVADTKLALREKPAFLVQLCLYAQFVAQIQGAPPARVLALFGDGSQTAYDPLRYLPYVRRAQGRFAGSLPALAVNAVPDRIGACGTCAWSDCCDDARRAVDHLSFVASIRREQIAKLSAAGITTLAQLAAASDDVAPRGMGSFVKLRRQARLQLRQRTTGEYVVELLDPLPRKGFALMPQPDEHDVYFDMEGDPLYEAGRGLEYLFGAYVGGEQSAYRSFWGETRDDERRAFVAFVDWLVEHRRLHPAAHVYHYAAYERTALRRLAMEHATREDEIDRLLREGAFVDLYSVVQGALVQSQDGYSIKKLEPFYGFERSAGVRKGDQSIVAFEEYLLDRDARIRDDIIRYNEEDCVSTAGLHRWLLNLRPGDGPWRDEGPDGEQREENERDLRRRTLEEALLAGAPEGSPQALAAHLLAYHRREDKPAYWAYFDRIEHPVDFVHDDNESLGGLELSADPAHAPIKAPGARNPVYTYTFPSQQFKLGRGPCDPATGAAVNLIGVDEDACVVRIKHAADAPHPRALIPGRPLRKDAQVDALERFAQAVLDGTVAERYSAGWDILRRARPRIAGLVEGAVVQPARRDGADAIDPADIADLVGRLDAGALVVQGPPGTGKTYAGAHVVAALLRSGKRVGITSTSHKAIHNLLREIDALAVARGLRFRGVKKCDAAEAETQYVSDHDFIENVGQNESFAGYDLVAATAWLFARADFAPVDVLIVDEAGQVALADAIAVATAARSVVLLGDPLQLAHVSQGTHPDGAGASVLTHLVGAEGTVAPDRGVFLDRSFRMHPALTSFVSEMLYDRRLESVASCALQRIDAPWFSGAGLRYVPVEHTGNVHASEEEAAAVVGILEGLVGGTFTDRHGRTRPLRVEDVLVVAPYNAQVRLLGRRLRSRFGDTVRVGTVDKFQGQEAAAVVYSLATSSAEDAPRGADFLFERNRFNVAVSRGRALAVTVCSPRLLAAPCSSVSLLGAVAMFCAFAEAAGAAPTSNYSLS